MEIARLAAMPVLAGADAQPRPAAASEAVPPLTAAAVEQPGASPRVEAAPAPLSGDRLDRRITIDLETRKAVFQAVDEQTGDVIVQLPDPSVLAAYADRIRVAESAGPSVNRTV